MSRIADEIVEEYKRRKAFEKKQREKCTSKKCKECKYEKNMYRKWNKTIIETKILNKISNLIDKTKYKTAYVEILTENDRYTLEKSKKNQIGFKE